MSSTDDSLFLYLIDNQGGIKDSLVDIYDTYAENLSDGMIQKLKVKYS